MLRLRETQLFKNSSLQALVSSTRNATLKKQVASRLRETLLFFDNYALVYAKHYFCSAHLAGMGAVVPLRHLTIPKNECSRLRETTLFKIYTQKLSKTLSKMICRKTHVSSRARKMLCFFISSRLVYAKHYFFAPSRSRACRRASL